MSFTKSYGRLILACCWLACCFGAAAETEPNPGSAQDYARHCMGCHGALGATVDEVPQLRGRAGYFARTAAGRAYLAQVPGVARAPLSNDRVAALLNWLLLNYSARELPQGFVPFTEEEVSALRKMDIVPTAVRAQVVRELVEQGVPPQALKLPAPRLY